MNQTPEPIVTDTLALWLNLRAPENPYSANRSLEKLHWDLGRRSLAKELLDLYRKQTSDSRATAIEDIHNKLTFPKKNVN